MELKYSLIENYLYYMNSKAARFPYISSQKRLNYYSKRLLHLQINRKEKYSPKNKVLRFYSNSILCFEPNISIP